MYLTSILLYTFLDTFEGRGVLLCQVCSDRASGFHYGINSCEGCKVFFKQFFSDYDSVSYFRASFVARYSRRFSTKRAQRASNAKLCARIGTAARTAASKSAWRWECRETVGFLKLFFCLFDDCR